MHSILQETHDRLWLTFLLFLSTRQRSWCEWMFMMMILSFIHDDDVTWILHNFLCEWWWHLQWQWHPAVIKPFSVCISLSFIHDVVDVVSCGLSLLVFSSSTSSPHRHPSVVYVWLCDLVLLPFSLLNRTCLCGFSFEINHVLSVQMCVQFDRSNRGKSDSICGLEEVLSNLTPSVFVDEQLSKYKVRKNSVHLYCVCCLLRNTTQIPWTFKVSGIFLAKPDACPVILHYIQSKADKKRLLSFSCEFQTWRSPDISNEKLRDDVGRRHKYMNNAKKRTKINRSEQHLVIFIRLSIFLLISFLFVCVNTSLVFSFSCHDIQVKNLVSLHLGYSW